MKLKPLNDRVVVSPLDAEVKTAGGVILPDAAQEKPNTGDGAAVGAGVLNETTGDRHGVSVKKGDLVYYGKYAGTEVKVQGKELKILRESDILAVEE